MKARVEGKSIINYKRKLRDSVMRMRQIIATVLMLTLLAFGITGGETVAYAEGQDDSLIIFSENNVNLDVKPGETAHIKLPISTTGAYIYDPVASIEDANAQSPFEISKPTMISEYNQPVHMLISDLTVYIEFDIKIKETAGIGFYPLDLMIKGKTGLEQNPMVTSLPFKLRILEEKAPAQLTIRSVSYENAMPGKDTMLTFVVRNEGEIIARNSFLSIDYKETGIINRYTATKVKVGDLAYSKEQLITLPISVLTTADAGTKTLPVTFTYKDIDGKSYDSVYNIYVDIETNEKAPNLDFVDASYPKGLKPGDKFVLKATLRNFGEANAVKSKVSVEETETVGFIKNYLTDAIQTSDVKSDGSVKIEIPMIVSKSASGDLNKLVLKFDYYDSLGVPYTKTKTLYIDVVSPETAKENIVISNVKQSSSSPVAGERLDVSFNFENKGSIDITELKISLSDLTGNTFIPVDSKPYIYIEEIKAGATKQITIPLTVSKSIQEGLNVLKLAYTYTGGPGGTVEIPVLDIQNDQGSVSKPKLIVSKYEVDLDELRAGSVFNFTFDIRNTHSSVSAKNMTVKVASSAQGQSGQSEVFTVTQGGNSFFINKIDPNETIQTTLELKVKSDAATAAYPIYIIMEYEYDGIEPNPTTGKVGESETEELSLQVIENSRPVVDYVNVYSWDGVVTVGNPATIGFEFYNMGKSQLNNVIATVEGDFTNSTGSMYFMGNVQAGYSSYAEFEAIPNIEGMAKGIIKITYEDSNGEEVEYTKEFETSVMGEMAWEPGFDDGGVDVFNPMVPEAKKAILPTWLFIIIQVVIFAAFVPITRKIIITVHRNKLRKKDEENYL